MSAANNAARRKRSPMSPNESARQLRRATLGVGFSEITSSVGMRIDQWVDAQLALPVVAGQMQTSMRTSRYPGLPTTPVLDAGWPGLNQFMNWKIRQPSKLRTRIAYALQEYFSVGGAPEGLGAPTCYGALWDTFEEESVGGTFRSLIERVTRSQVMGRWLTYWKNTKSDGVRQPDENFAREILQLYTIGLWELNSDGTRRLSGELDVLDPRYVVNGTNEVPTYSQIDIANLARVFTGMAPTSSDDGVTILPLNETYTRGWLNAGNSEFRDAQGNVSGGVPMTFASDYHESSLPKVALHGMVNIPIGASGETSLAATLDALSSHPSVAPFFCKNMIRLLTTSNPSLAYTSRVVSVFLNDGQGLTGNLRAVFRAIFLDQEVLAPIEKSLTVRVPSFEEQRFSALLSQSPILTSEGAPAVGTGAYPGDPSLDYSLTSMGYVGPLQVFQNPSVFGRWPKEYAAAGSVFSSGMVSPELASLTESYVTDLLNSGELIEILANSAEPADIENASAAGSPALLLDKLSLVLTGGTAPQTYLDSLNAWIGTRSATDTATNRQENYRNIAACLWLSPWSIVRK